MIINLEDGILILNVIGLETTIPFKEKSIKGTRAKYFTTVSFTLQP